MRRRICHICLGYAFFLGVSGVACAQGGAGASGSSATVSQSPGAYNVPTGTTDSTRTFERDRNAQLTLDRAQEEIRSQDEQKKPGRIVPAQAQDIVVGASVRDIDGLLIGTVEIVKPEGVQLVSGSMHAMVPADGFGMSRAGLVVNTTKAGFDRQASQ